MWNKKDDKQVKKKEKSKPVSTCSPCKGTGMVEFHQKASMRGPEQWGKKTCPSCKGKGVK